MADSKVNIKFAGDAAGAERAFTQLEKKVDDLTNKLKHAGRTSKESADGSDRLASAIAGIAGSVATVSGAVAFGRQAWATYAGEIDKASAAADTLGKKLTAALAKSGDLLQGDRIQQALSAIPNTPLAISQAAFGGVREGAPSLDLGKALEISAAVAGATGFVNAENPDAVSATGRLSSKLAELAPGKSASDIVDLAVGAQGAAGRNIDALMGQGSIKTLSRLTSQEGMSIEDALGLLIRGLDVGFKGKSLEDVKKKDMRLLGEGNIAGIADTLRNAQTGDIALQNLTAAAGLQPDDFLAYQSKARRERTLRGEAAAEDAFQAHQEANMAAAGPGFWSSTGAWIGNKTEDWMWRTPRRILGMGGPGGIGDIGEQVNAQAGQGLQEHVKALNANTQAMEANTKAMQADNKARPVNRQAHVESAAP